MYDYSDSSPPADVCLLLRAHAEQLWLSREILPVLRQLQTPGGLPEEQLGAALAYLEVVWLEASRLAAETESAFVAVEAGGAVAEASLPEARRYHAAVRLCREAAADCVRALTGNSAALARTSERASA